MTKLFQASCCAALSACAGSAGIKQDDVPASLRAPEGRQLVLKVHAIGVQIYVCQLSSDDTSRFEWFLKAPQAQLFDRNERAVGKHYAGPTWESNDGSMVVGSVVAKETPDPKSVPWLLLSVKSNAGHGVFSDVRSIQRLRTAGGIAPSAPCGQTQLNQELRTAYSADYLFYR